MQPDCSKLKQLIQTLRENINTLHNTNPNIIQSITRESDKEAIHNAFAEALKIEDTLKSIKETRDEIIQTLKRRIIREYSYTNSKTNKEHKELINIDIEEQIQEHITFYNQTNINLPPNFRETALDIWNRNYSEIQSQIEQRGFNGVLIVPGNIPLETLLENMNTSDGEDNNNQPHKGFYFGNNFKNAGGTSTCISTGTDKTRIILYHKKTLPEIQEQNGVDPHLDIKAQQAQELYDQNPDKYLSNLIDVIILERKHHDETGIHISDWRQDSGVWLPATKQQGSTRFVLCCWDPGLSALYVYANVAESAYSAIGCRSSCYFI
jgi:hypothetical protein